MNDRNYNMIYNDSNCRSSLYLFRFHVSTLLDSEHQRRLIGNDKTIIYFQEDTPFCPQFRGRVNSVGVVVKPSPKNEETGEKGYQVGCYTRGRVRQFYPKIPKSEVRDKKKLKDIIIATGK